MIVCVYLYMCVCYLFFRSSSHTSGRVLNLFESLYGVEYCTLNMYVRHHSGHGPIGVAYSGQS